LPENIELLEFPFSGNLCLRVHRGYKIFDFERKTVTKIFLKNVNPFYINHEIAAVRLSSQLDFAPNIINWNYQDRWYEEEFINGRPCFPIFGSAKTLADGMFEREIAPCLERMMLLQKPMLVDIQEYTEKLFQIIDERKASITLSDETKLNSINHFLEFVKKSLNFKKIKLPLVFSHGDFSLVNILNTQDGKKVIDWEGAAPRNPLYDLYNFFLTELYYNRATKSLVAEIREATLFLQSLVRSREPNIAETFIEFTRIYRRIYYLERICLLFERTLNQNVVKVIFRSVEVFNSYETKMV
jgi:hypothetical protein